jgi:hypothetical protein
MNWKAIGVFSFLLLLLGVLSGMLFGMWAAINEQVLNKTWYFHAQYIVDIVVEVTIFYNLFKRVAIRPLLHAIIVILISWTVAAILQLIVVGLAYQITLMLILIDIVVASISIFVAQILAKYENNRGQTTF